MQCSEVSANRASVTGGAPRDRAAHSSWERGVGSEKSTPEKTAPKGCYLSRRAVFIRQAPPRLLWGWQQPLGTRRCVSRKPRVHESWEPAGGRGGGPPLGAAGEVVTCCSQVISKASWRSHSLRRGSSVPRWLSKAGPRPSAGLGVGWGPLPAVCLPPLPATPPSSAGLNFIPQSGIVFSLMLVIL